MTTDTKRPWTPGEDYAIVAFDFDEPRTSLPWLPWLVWHNGVVARCRTAGAAERRAAAYNEQNSLGGADKTEPLTDDMDAAERVATTPAARERARRLALAFLARAERRGE